MLGTYVRLVIMIFQSSKKFLNLKALRAQEKNLAAQRQYAPIQIVLKE